MKIDYSGAYRAIDHTFFEFVFLYTDIPSPADQQDNPLAYKTVNITDTQPAQEGNQPGTRSVQFYGNLYGEETGPYWPTDTYYYDIDTSKGVGFKVYASVPEFPDINDYYLNTYPTYDAIPDISIYQGAVQQWYDDLVALETKKVEYADLGGNLAVVTSDTSFVLADWIEILDGPSEIIGSAYDDVIEGWDGNDIIEGGSGNDRLIGGRDDDILRGGGDDDILIGGEHGTNQLFGGDGLDTAAFISATAAYTWTVESYEKFINSVSGTKFKIQSSVDGIGQTDIVDYDIERQTFAGVEVEDTTMYNVAGFAALSETLQAMLSFLAVTPIAPLAAGAVALTRSLEGVATTALTTDGQWRKGFVEMISTAGGLGLSKAASKAASLLGATPLGEELFLASVADIVKAYDLELRAGANRLFDEIVRDPGILFDQTRLGKAYLELLIDGVKAGANRALELLDEAKTGTGFQNMESEGVSPFSQDGAIPQAFIDAASKITAVRSLSANETLKDESTSLDNMLIQNFTEGNRLVVLNQTFSVSDMAITLGSAILDIDLDGDATPDIQIVMTGDFTGAVFNVANTAEGTEITVIFEPLILQGAEGDDFLLGTGGNDDIDGLFGNDTIDGGGGVDTLTGGEGFDHIIAGDGDDFVFGGSGADDIDGGFGNDEIDAGAGEDLVVGGGGDDLLMGGEGDDNLAGDSGADTITGGAGADIISGGSGGDLILGDDGDPDAFAFLLS